MKAIYALADPRNDEVHYVGQSSDPMARYRGHVAVAKRRRPCPTRLLVWILALITNDLMPVLVILQPESDDPDGDEQRWIEKLLAAGQPLANVQPALRGSGQSQPPLTHQRKRRPRATMSGDQLRRHRISLGMTQQDLGHATGYSDTTISKYESGTRRIPSRLVLALAKIAKSY